MKKYLSLSILVLTFNTMCFSQTPKISESDTKKLNELIADAADSLMNKIEWKDLVGDEAAENFEALLRVSIDGDNASTVKYLADTYKAQVDNAIEKATAAGLTVPKSLRKLSDEFGEKSKQADNFLKKGN